MTRYFEDFSVGSSVELGAATVSEHDIVEFARTWDPQGFHIDPAAAAASPYGGLIASGVHTFAIFMRLFVDGLLRDAASLGSPGVDEVRWPRPVRPDDTVSARYTVLSARPSASRPDRGIVVGVGEVRNQRDEPVLTVQAVNLFGRRPPV